MAAQPPVESGRSQENADALKRPRSGQMSRILLSDHISPWRGLASDDKRSRREVEVLHALPVAGSAVEVVSRAVCRHAALGQAHVDTDAKVRLFLSGTGSSADEVTVVTTGTPPRQRLLHRATDMMRSRAFTILALLCSMAVVAQDGEPRGDWVQLGGSPDATRFSPLSQVNTENVSGLALAWASPLGFTGRVQGAPAAWEGLLFVSTQSGVVAFDGVSGEPVWSYLATREEAAVPDLPLQAPRGSPVVVRHDSGATLYASLPTGPEVVALDASTGSVKWRTSVGGTDFAEALRTNPILAGDVLVVGPTGADLSPAPGRLVALDPEDGEVAWSIDLVPLEEDDPARATWSPYAPGRSYGVGGGSAWNAGAYDPETGVVIYGTGQPFPSDNLDPRRFDGDGRATPDLYTSSFVAIDAVTGELRWFHQVVPGDEWGYDQHTVPVIADLQLDRGTVRAALLATTTGYVLVVDAATGEMITAHRLMEESNVHVGYDSEGNSVIDEKKRRRSQADVMQICPGTRWANIAPGAYSPLTGLLYRPNDRVCSRIGAGNAPDDWQPGARPTWLLSEVRLPDDYFERWGALTAIDPLTGDVAWSFELPYPHDSGVLATAGGLVFSAFADRQFRAFDAATGEVLWSQVLTAHSDAAPITYMAGGVQYVAVMAGRDIPVPSLPESGLPPSITGPATLFAFSLPDPP